MRDLAEYRKILIFLRYGIGDVVMELPALDQLRRRAPGAFITAVGARPALQLLEGDARVDELIAVQDFGFRDWAEFGDAGMRDRLSKWLDRRQFDLYIDPTHAVFGISEQVHARGVDILDSNVPSVRTVLANGGSGAEALRTGMRDGWGVEIPPRAFPVVTLNAEEKRYAGAVLRGLGWEAARPAALSPVASSALKQWDAKRFAATADALLESGTEAILIFAGRQKEAAGRIRDAMTSPRRAVIIGPIHLRKVAALLERCCLFVGNDTGLTHLAAAVATPVVAIFGPTSPITYRPDSPPTRTVGGLEPCPWRRLGDFGPSDCIMQGRCLNEPPCIGKVPVEEVLISIREAGVSVH